MNNKLKGLKLIFIFLDKEPPKLVACPNDLSLVSDKKLATVVLPPVRFRDNNKVLRVDATVENGTEITWGTYDVIFTASDPSGNKAVCAFKLRIFCKLVTLYSMHYITQILKLDM